MSTYPMTAREWVERAKETLEQRLEEDDDTQLIDAHDDLCNALDLMEKEL